MATLAVARVLDAALRDQVFDVLLIKRLAESVAVCGLSPLRVRVRVAFAATLRRDEHLAGNKAAGGRRRVARRKRILSELEIVVLQNLVVVTLDGIRAHALA